LKRKEEIKRGSDRRGRTADQDHRGVAATTATRGGSPSAKAALSLSPRGGGTSLEKKGGRLIAEGRHSGAEKGRFWVADGQE